MVQRCLICGKPLKDEESKARKIGPTCWKIIERLALEERLKRQTELKLKREAKGQTTLFEM
jgi:hypothetical protein